MSKPSATATAPPRWMRMFIPPEEYYTDEDQFRLLDALESHGFSFEDPVIRAMRLYEIQRMLSTIQ